MVEARREAEARDASAVADYRAWLVNENGEEGRPRFDDGPDFENLQHLAECDFDELTRKRPDELTQARRFVAWRDGTPVDWEQEKYKPSAEHWFIAQDRHWVVPFAQADAALDEYARRWRDAHHNFRGQEVAVFLPPGESLQFVMWSDEPLGRDAVQSYLDALSGHVEEPRYTSVAYPWRPWRCESVYLPAAFEASTSFRERGAATGGSALVLLDTGIAALNKQFRVSGLPLGARVVIGGLTGQGKTTLGVHLAEAACAKDWFVVWVAYDEARDEIQARRLQRRGFAPEVAQTLPPAAMAELDKLDFFVVPAGTPFEELARDAHAEANGRPVFFVVDSIQKLETRVGEGKGERERITAAVDTIQASQAKYPSTVVMTAEIARGSGATKGSGAIDYGATLALRVKRNGAKLLVSIPKNRHGTEQPFELQLDMARQSVSEQPPKLPQPSSSDTPAAASIRTKLLDEAKREPRSRRALEEAVTGKAVTKREAIAALIESGELVRDGKVCRVPCVPVRPSTAE
jgi:hypothetical protein